MKRLSRGPARNHPNYSMPPAQGSVAAFAVIVCKGFCLGFLLAPRAPDMLGLLFRRSSHGRKVAQNSFDSSIRLLCLFPVPNSAELILLT